MRRLGSGLVAIALLAASCSFAAETTTTTTLEPAAAPVTTTTTSTTTTTLMAITTTTSPLASVPPVLPIVAEPMDWTRLVEAEFSFDARYDGTYLVMELERGTVVVMQEGETVVRHTSVDDQEWIVQDIELGDRWLAIVENTEKGNAQSHLVVYELPSGDVVFEELGDLVDGRLTIPNVSLSGRYMALGPSREAAPNCVAIYDLESSLMIDEICGDAPAFRVELDGDHLAFGTRGPECESVWTATLYGQDHSLVEHESRECWSKDPAGGSLFTIWFESPPQTASGNDVLIGETAAGDMVGLGRGDTGTAEVCWNRAYWVGGNGDVRSWDGGDTVTTIYAAEGAIFSVTCSGQWVTVATAEGIYAANIFTKSGVDACGVVEVADAERTANMATDLGIWAQEQSDDLPSDLRASVTDAIGSGGWWVGRGSFSSHLEDTIFLWNPRGDIQAEWSGDADSQYEIRQYMVSLLPEIPPALFGCVNVDGYVG